MSNATKISMDYLSLATCLSLLFQSASARPFDWVQWPPCVNGRTLTFSRDMAFINISHCSLTRIDSDSFQPVRQLTTLYLNDNDIQFIAPGAFDPLPHLKKLYLQDSNLLGRELYPDMFYNNNKLSILQLSGNDMRKTPVSLLHGSNVMNLYLQSCSLEEMPRFIGHTSLPSLKLLNLDTNHISRLTDPKIFENTTQLEKLHLCCNGLDSLHEDIFNKLTMLSHVYLHMNKLEHLPEKLFQNKTKLSTIHLNDNLLHSIPADAFIGTPLEKLYLNGNRLTFLPDNLIRSINFGGRLKILSLTLNPWQCGCLNEILIASRALGISTVSNYNGREIVCVMKNFKCDKTAGYRDMYHKAVLKRIEQQVGYILRNHTDSR